MKCYNGSLWHADETDGCVRIHRDAFQIIKAPKQSDQFVAYWPDAPMIEWILATLNAAEGKIPLFQDPEGRVFEVMTRGLHGQSREHLIVLRDVSSKRVEIHPASFANTLKPVGDSSNGTNGGHAVHEAGTTRKSPADRAPAQNSSLADSSLADVAPDAASASFMDDASDLLGGVLEIFQ